MNDFIHRYDAHDDPIFDWSKIPDIERTIPALLGHGLKHHPDHDVLVFDDQRITYAEAEQRSALLARHLLGAGIGKGARVGMVFPNTPEFLVTFLAITRIGAVAVPMSTFSSTRELHGMTRRADLVLLIAADRYLNHDYVDRLATAFPSAAGQRAPLALSEAPALRRIWISEAGAAWPPAYLAESTPAEPSLLEAVEATVVPADPAAIIHTSGSTSEPKGVIHSHGTLLRQACKIAASYPWQGDDRVYTPMPFFWVGGLTLNLLNLMQYGGTVVTSSATAACDLLDFIDREQATYVVAWPHTARAMAADPSFAGRDFSYMRGGVLFEALPPERRPKAPFGQALGMSETAGPHHISPVELPDEMDGSFGTPMPGMELLLVDPSTGEPLADDGAVGVLLVRGDCLMVGMVGRERHEYLDADGWYRTGDLCSYRGRFLFFHGREDDMIKTAGSNVSPGEVQEALLAIPGVAQAHITGVPDDVLGAVVAAVVVPAPGASLTEEQLRADARKTLSSYKVPRHILLMDAADLPMMSSGKVDRLALVAKLRDLREAAGH